ncbi:Dolichyl-diphosphooligosaccharide--protein glycosyltransferase subunit 1 [Nakaseomyces bracarensis]|uniref:Dolichyl-diphosphooligosaccharide--protein glycosyltransferase subunit 1 n=1 Tax=Nakaseomyces bracarensis TaxID=273131 RepID=A0ABR4P0T1_9SACH
MVALKVWAWFFLCIVGHVLGNEVAEEAVSVASEVIESVSEIIDADRNVETSIQSEVASTVAAAPEERNDNLKHKKNPVDWVNIKYQRIIDLSGVGITEEVRVVAKNIGEKATDEYHVLLPFNIFSKMSAFSAAMGDAETDGSGFVKFRALSATLKQLNNMEVGFGFLTLPKVVEVGETIELRIIYKYNECGVPSPEKIGMNDPQYLKYEFYRLPFSFYNTESAVLLVGGSDDIQELNVKNVEEQYQGQLAEKAMQFGEFTDIPRLTIEKPVTIRYLHDKALNEVVYLKRDLWISHWAGTLEFSEYYEYQNKGAGLIDNYSRKEIMKNPQLTQKATVRAVIEHKLPEGSTDQYTVDKVGKINTAQMNEGLYYIKPRFPIYGGWAYNYTIGWTNVLKDFLRVNESDSESFILAAPILNGPMDTAYDLVEYSVYLPEGAEFVEAKSPLPFMSLDVSNENSYFDLQKGHVKVTFTFRNIVNEVADSQILVTYNYSKEALYSKFLRISFYIFVALMSFFFLNAINLRVTKK